MINQDNSHQEAISKDLIERIAHGDEYSFTVFYNHFIAVLRPIRYQCIGSDLDDFEVMQLTFLKIWLNREKLLDIDNVKSWVIKVSYREYLMALRKKIKYEERIGKYGQELLNNNAPFSMLDSFNYKQLKDDVQRIVFTLSPQRRTIYELSRNEGLKVEEIAERLSISTNTVKSTLQTVLKIIREKLDFMGYGPFVWFFYFFSHWR